MPRHRRNNRRSPREPYVVLYAQKRGGPRLKYVGHRKFAKRGRPVLFRDQAEANLVAWVLRDLFPKVLEGYKLFPK